MERRTTIYDIAQTAGVSATSVYKALHGKGGISEETRERILEIAAESSFTINKFAQTLTRREIKIGVVFEQENSPYSRSALKGVQDEFQQIYDYKVQPIYGQMEPSVSYERTMRELTALMDAHADGIILDPNMLDYTDAAVKLKNLGIPLLTLTNDISNPELRLCSVANNAYVIGSMAAELLEMICRGGRYAVLTSFRDVSSQNKAVQGFKGFLLRCGNPFPPGVYEMKNDDSTCYNVTDSILSDIPDLKGIFISSSFYSGLCRRLSELGLQNKVAVVGVDIDDEIAAYINAGTVNCTIFQNPYWQGRLVVRTMFEHLVLGKTPPLEILVNPRTVYKSNIFAYNNDSINLF